MVLVEHKATPFVMKIHELLSHAAQHLEQTGVPNARRDAERLLEFALAKDRSYLLAHFQETVEPSRLDAFFSLVAERSSGKPLQYLLGEQEFCGLDFEVTPAVLIPRPETELAVEEALRRFPQGKRLMVDVGTGSGCIAVSLAVAQSETNVLATDVSAAALAVAARNARRHGVSDRIQFLHGDLLSPLESLGVKGEIDCILSNPPYVAESDVSTLQREVRDWEPRLALTGGPSGLSVYVRLIPVALAYLKRGGYLITEIGYNMERQVSIILGPGWILETTREDLSGIPRVLVARKAQEQ
jgi:release factor glutamine methyltransferase